MLSDPDPRPPACYDSTIAPHRDDGAPDVVHVHDHAGVRGLLRDARRVTADVSEALTVEQRAHVHPVAAFVWATDRRTLGGAPGRHATLRALMGPWFAATRSADRRPVVTAATNRMVDRLAGHEADRPFDVFDDYALPLVVETVADWLGVTRADVRYAVADQVAQGEMFARWPPPSTPGMDEHYRELMRRPDLTGVAAEVRDLAAAGLLTEREAWGVVYSVSVSSIATAAAITLTVGLTVEHGQWPGMRDPAAVHAAVEESVRLGNPFPQASRFVREPFTIGDVAVVPGDQVLLWLTAANRGLPGVHAQPLDRFDPRRDTAQHLGWGSGYHLCAGVHHARAIAGTAVTVLAEHCPHLRLAGPWRRFVGIDDGFASAPAVRC